MIQRAMFRLAIVFVAFCIPVCCVRSDDNSKFVVVLYPEANDGSPGSVLADRGIRAVFRGAYQGAVEIHNEYLDVSRFPDSSFQDDLAKFLRRKYAGRKTDLVIAGLGSGLDYALKYRDEIFPGVPIVFCAIDRKQIAKRQLPADVLGVPSHWDLAGSLEVGLKCVPGTRHVYVVVGKSKFDKYWEAEARERFHNFSERVEVVFLAGLPMTDLVARLAALPEHSLVYYLHIFEDGDGKAFSPAEGLELIATKANAPIFCHVDSYIGRGAVGGRVFSFELAGKNAAELGVRVLAGQRPESIGVQSTAENAYEFDWRQLQRWRIHEANLPAGSIVRFKVPTVWEAYKWHWIALISVCLLQGLMIAGLIVQRARQGRAERQRHEAESELSQSQATLRELAGKLLTAEQTERRRIARELHDDLGQGLALLSVELDLLQQKSPVESGELKARVAALSARIKQLSTSIHELSHRLHPMKLEQLGLVATLRALCKELGESHGLEIQFLHDAIPSSIPPDIAICLYRVAQEGLQNIVKHSQARHVGVELHLPDGSICLQIYDDGIGFNPNSAATQEGLGLASMRERMRLVNGEIQVKPRATGGTEILAVVPLAGPPGG